MRNVLSAGNIHGYVVQRAHFVHIKAPVDRFHLKYRDISILTLLSAFSLPNLKNLNLHLKIR